MGRGRLRSIKNAVVGAGRVRSSNGGAFFINMTKTAKKSKISDLDLISSAEPPSLVMAESGSFEKRLSTSAPADECANDRVNHNRTFRESCLKSNISWPCFIMFLCCCMMSIAGLVFINAAQIYVLVDILDYPRNRLGEASGTLAFADELLCIPMVSFWGFLSDRFGRGRVMSLCLALMASAIYLYPLSSCVFPSELGDFFHSLLFLRLLFAVGGSGTTTMITALIGDYAVDGGRAKVAGFSGTAAGLGALLSGLIFVRLPIIIPSRALSWLNAKRPDIIASYGITASCIMIVAIFASIYLLKSGNDEMHSMPLKRRVETGIKAIKNPLIALAYFSGFVARSESIALNLFIGPWVDNYLTKSGLCPPVQDSVYVRCEPAKRLTSNLMSTSHLATLIGAPLFGILCDNCGPLMSVLIPAIIGFISFGILFLSSRPDSMAVYTCMFFSGLADIGMIISSMALISAQSSDYQRGALAGMYSFFGAIGIILTSKIGGYLFDAYRESAAFSFVSISSGLLALCLICRCLLTR